jgi:hypothetical protein
VGFSISEMDDLWNDWLEDLYLLTHPYHLRRLFLSGLIGDASSPVSKSRKRKDFKDVKGSKKQRSPHQAKNEKLPRQSTLSLSDP